VNEEIPTRSNRRKVCGWLFVLFGPVVLFGPYLYLWSNGAAVPWKNPYEPYFYPALFLALSAGLCGLFIIPKSNGAPQLIGCGYLLAVTILLVVWSFAWCPGDCLP
jgi:peptidoglycan/LPS O-acetylase OafA/YrhL